MELQLVHAFCLQIQCYQGKKTPLTMLNPGCSGKKKLFHTTKLGQNLKFNTGVELKLVFWNIYIFFFRLSLGQAD